MKLRPKWSAVNDLAAAAGLLQEKALLLALMEMFFRRPSNQRTVSFADIVAATKLPLDKVWFWSGYTHLSIINRRLIYNIVRQKGV